MIGELRAYIHDWKALEAPKCNHPCETAVFGVHPQLSRTLNWCLRLATKRTSILSLSPFTVSLEGSSGTQS